MESIAQEQRESLSLDIISYEDFMREDPRAQEVLEKALHDKGIVGIRGVPGFKEKVLRFIEQARAFSQLSEKVKERYAPDRTKGDMFLGYERGKEKFKRPDGRWVVDDLKVSYYGYVPDCPANKWPSEIDLQNPFQEVGLAMSRMGLLVMERIGLIGEKTGISLEGTPQVGRMLYYRKSSDSLIDNPFWCGAHFDHGMFTVLLPAFYFVDGEPVLEPEESGLFVKTTGVFKKVVVQGPEVMLFQVGEFGQLVTNDAIRATEHRVHKASGHIERYTMALFYDAPQETVIYSTSELTQDARYGGQSGEACSYRKWSEESYKRYLVTQDK